MRQKIREIIAKTINDDSINFSVEIPKDEKFGDYSTNVAMILTKKLKKNPRDIANDIIEKIKDNEIFDKIDVAGPGFINFFIRKEAWINLFDEIYRKGEDFYKLNIGNGKKVLIEFVSANPTGPLHIGHGRGAVVGDVLAKILSYAGFKVLKEYYINDAGNQMKILGESIKLRAKQIINNDELENFPDGYYKGEYIISIAKEMIKKFGKDVVNESTEFFTKYGINKIMPEIIDDLKNFGVEFDNFFSEKSLFDNGEVNKVINFLKEKGYLYEKDGAWWLKVEGDDDRVVIKSDGSYTYLASDIAYHKNKYERGFDEFVNIWGADHHGYIPRIKSAIKHLGFNPEKLKIILVQMVNLLRGGEKVVLSTRAGNFVTLKEVVDEVGKDAARFIFMTRKSDAHLDFDLEVAKLQTNENPVYYVQYAHARICSILRNSKEAPKIGELFEKEEFELIKKVDDLKEIILISARNYEPHLITYYLIELAGIFHSFYNKHKVLGNPVRLALILIVKNAIKLGLDLLGIEAPERM